MKKNDAASCNENFNADAQKIFAAKTTIINLKHVINNDKVVITWNVLPVVNTFFFEVYHSNDGVHFKLLGTVRFLNEAVEYAFSDIQPAIGINYYKIKSVDTDGTNSFSKILQVNLNDK